MRYVIVNGDDFGLSAGVNRGIIEAHRRGILTSTSLLVNRPDAVEAARLVRELPSLSVGLHLEFDRAEQPPSTEVVDEQLARFKRLTGGSPTHLDSHHDVHRTPSVLPHALQVAGRLGIPLRGHSPVRCHTSFYGQWDGETHREQVSVHKLVDMLSSEIGEGVTEIVCHPGYVDARLTTSYADVRATEVRTLCDPRVRAAIEFGGIQLIGFRDLPDVIGASPNGGGRA